jgi:hypothetical protein
MTFISGFGSSVWKLKSGVISGSSSLVIDTSLAAASHYLKYIIVIYNDSEGKTKSFEYTVLNNGGVLKSTVHDKIGVFNISIDEQVVSGSIEVEITNNETHTANYKLAVLKL